MGEFGPAQQRHFGLVALAGALSASMCCLSMVSAGSEHQPRLILTQVFANSKPAWQPVGGGQVEADALPPCGTLFEMAEPSHSLRAEWRLVCEDERLAGLLDSLFFVGFGAGAFLFGASQHAAQLPGAHSWLQAGSPTYTAANQPT